MSIHGIHGWTGYVDLDLSTVQVLRKWHLMAVVFHKG